MTPRQSLEAKINALQMLFPQMTNEIKQDLLNAADEYANSKFKNIPFQPLVSGSLPAEEIFNMIVGGMDASPNIPGKNFRCWVVRDDERDAYIINMLKDWKGNDR